MVEHLPNNLVVLSSNLSTTPTQNKSFNTIHHIKNWKGARGIKIHPPFLIKTLSKVKIKQNFLHIIKVISKKIRETPCMMVKTKCP
jgi:hypothetical protein